MAAGSICLWAAALLMMLVFSPCAVSGSDALHALSLAKVERRIDLTTQVVRVTVALKVENGGSEPASNVLFALKPEQAKNLALLKAGVVEGKGKNRGLGAFLAVQTANAEGLPADYAFYSIALNKPLSPGESVSLEVFAAFTHLQTPFPAEISQSDVQLVVYRDNAFFLAPYHTKVQTTSFKVPSTRIESYTKVVPVKGVETDLRYGPYEDVAPLSEQPVALHFENSQPFAVVETLEREIEISHWGNVYVTENYHLKHAGAKLKGSFSRFDYQSRAAGAASFRRLYARLPPRAHSVYYRDEIGNISTSHLFSDRSKTDLELEPRYPMFGGWQVTFTLGYSLPLEDFVFKSKDGRQYLNITFGSPFGNLVVNKLVVKVVLPEASADASVSIPIDVETHQEVKHTYLDTVGRTVLVLTKHNYVVEHNTFFQVYYRFRRIALLVEPLLLALGFFILFLAFIALTHFDWTIAKSSASYQARLYREDFADAMHRLQKFLQIRATVGDRLESALRDLARTGDIATCKAARKGADVTFKDTGKELKAVLESLQSSARAFPLLAKVEQLVAKDREKQDKLLQKHTVTVELYERKLSSKEIDSRIAPYQQKLASLTSEIQELQSVLDD